MPDKVGRDRYTNASRPDCGLSMHLLSVVGTADDNGADEITYKCEACKKICVCVVRRD
jgi:hypothetical protein